MASNTPLSDEPTSTSNSTKEMAMAGDSQTAGMAQGQRSLQEETKYWSKCIRQWFPDLLNTTYFVPPVHFNRVPYDVKSVAGQDVLVVKEPMGGAGPRQGQSVQGTSVKRKTKSAVYRRVKERLGKLFFGHSSQASTVNHNSMWTPTDLSKGLPGKVLDSDVRDDRAMTHLLCQLHEMANSQKEAMMVISEFKFSNYLNKLTTDMASHFLRPSVQGDFDLLIIHRQYGFLVGEVKSVGANREQLSLSEQEFEKSVVKKIGQAARQVKKASDVVQQLVSDLAPGMASQASIILPYVTEHELRRFLQANHQSAKKEVCECVACPDKRDFTEFFLCKEQLSSVSALSCWWQGWKTRNGVQPLMSDDLYQQIVARFVGPASTVEIHCVTPPRVELRTPGEGVLETGKRMTRLVLTPDQVDLLTRRPPRVFVTGPPGTGKTVVLALMALEWLREGHKVHVVSLDSRSCAASHLIEHQLQRSLDPNVTSTPGTVHRHQFNLGHADDMDRTVNTLSSFADNGHLYLILDEVPGPYTFESKNLKRFQSFCDQLVVRVPQLHLWAASLHHKYRPSVLQEEKLTTALRCPPVIVQNVRQSGEIDRYKSVYDYSHTEIPAPTHGPSIIRLIHSRDGHDGHTKTRLVRECELCGTNVAGVLKKMNVGLLKAGIPVQVLYDDVDVRDVTLGLHDRVTVSQYNRVQGLERKVVVVLEFTDWLDLLYSASRCTSQLIWIEPTRSRDLSVEKVDSNDNDDNNDNTDGDNTHHVDTSWRYQQQQK